MSTAHLVKGLSLSLYISHTHSLLAHSPVLQHPTPCWHQCPILHDTWPVPTCRCLQLFCLTLVCIPPLFDSRSFTNLVGLWIRKYYLKMYGIYFSPSSSCSCCCCCSDRSGEALVWLPLTLIHAKYEFPGRKTDPDVSMARKRGLANHFLQVLCPTTSS